MSPYKRGSIWYDDFWFQGQRYVGTTRQTTKGDALACEQDVRRRLRRQAAGLGGPSAGQAPRFQDWAEVHFHERTQHMSRPEFLEDNIRVILRFWGARPKQDDHPTDPYHDLRLDDPIRHPVWIERFEAWMRGRDSSPRHGTTIGRSSAAFTRPHSCPGIEPPAASPSIRFATSHERAWSSGP